MAIKSSVASLAGGSGAPKWIKDFVADCLISGAAALTAAGIGAIPQDTTQASIAGFAVAGAVLHALYRAALKWATS